MRFDRLTLGTVTLITTLAIAAPSGAAPPGAPHGDDKGTHDKPDDKNAHDKADKDKDDKDEGKGGHGKPDDDHDKGKDDDKPLPAQIEFRRALFERREKAILEVVQRDHKDLSDDEREAIRKHWRHLARLLRIRELAAIEKEDAIVKRVDADVEREEKAFSAKIEKLNAEAPVKGGAK